MRHKVQLDLLSYYLKNFPTRSNIKVSAVETLTSGFASDVYSFHLAYNEDGAAHSENLILKTYPAGAVGADRALRERHALDNLHTEGFPVPQPITLEVEHVDMERSFIVMQRIEGRVLWEAFESASDAEKRDLTALFTGLLADLHGLPFEVLVPRLLVRDEYTLIKREIYNLRAMITQQQREELSPVADWLHARRDSVPCKRPRITHRDYHPWNVLLTADDSGYPYRAYVIDWDWQIGDPRYDVAWMATLMERSGFADFRANALAEYERLTGAPLENFEYFEVLANARWLVNVTHSLETGAGLRNGAGERFRQFVATPIQRAKAMIRARTGIEIA
jgi:aminoglycoside phosphotransferase (APT) family kinase protein